MNPLQELPAAVAETLARFDPMPQKEWDAEMRKREMWPTVERWGFQQRFCGEIGLTAAQARVLNKVSEKMIGAGAIVALVGIRGAGKTTIAAQFAAVHAWRNFQEARRTDMGPRRIVCVSYRKATDILARFKPLYADFGSIDTERLTGSRDFYCRETEYAVIDELHECEDAKLKNRIFADMLDRRYAARRDTLLISNQTPEDFQQTTSDSILSRLSEHGAIMPCNWPSFRV